MAAMNQQRGVARRRRRPGVLSSVRIPGRVDQITSSVKQPRRSISYSKERRTIRAMPSSCWTSSYCVFRLAAFAQWLGPLSSIAAIDFRSRMWSRVPPMEGGVHDRFSNTWKLLINCRPSGER